MLNKRKGSKRVTAGFVCIEEERETHHPRDFSQPHLLLKLEDTIEILARIQKAMS
jgi:hypothetical protein